MAGSPCPVEVMKKVKTLMHMREVEIAYGMTETSPVSTQTRIGAPLDKQVGTVGQVHPHVRDQDHRSRRPARSCPSARRASCAPAATASCSATGTTRRPRAAAIDAARWMHTGDLAMMDEEGYLNIVGRIKDMIIRGGENVYPREIEEFLYTHPEGPGRAGHRRARREVRRGDHGLGAPARGRGRPRPRRSATICRGKIAHYKIPRYVKFVDAFPMTVTGKVQKFLMREQSVKELGLGKAAAVKMA